MADKPTINITRGRKKKPSGNSQETSASNNDSSQERAARSSSSEGKSRGIVGSVAGGVRSVWWMGLGMMGAARDEGERLFQALVEEGRAWEQERRDQASQRDVKEAGSEPAGAVSDQPSVDERLARRLRDGIDSTLDRVGIPTSGDIRSLKEQIDEITLQVDRIAQEMKKRQEPTEREE